MRRSNVPVHQNLLYADQQSARAVPRGDLYLDSCSACGYIWNSSFQPELLSYGDAYDNTQNNSPSFERHVEEQVARMVAEGVVNRDVVEVGCGKGYFLERLCEQGANRGTGYDPAYVGPPERLGGRLRFVRAFYGPEHAQGADVVVCRHVIEHVPDPVGFLDRVRAALNPTPNATVYFETPNLLWILEGTVIWDFFYEHCSYFTSGSLQNAFRRARFRPVAVRRTFKGQYLWARAVPTNEDEVIATPDNHQATRLARYLSAEGRKLSDWRDTMMSLAAEGRMAVWGAGAKGVTFVNLFDPAAARVDCLVDVNPAKDGRYAPGTGHPIVGPARLAARGLRDVILMNPNYLEETQRMISALGLKLRLHPAR